MWRSAFRRAWARWFPPFPACTGISWPCAWSRWSLSLSSICAASASRAWRSRCPLICLSERCSSYLVIGIVQNAARVAGIRFPSTPPPALPAGTAGAIAVAAAARVCQWLHRHDGRGGRQQRRHARLPSPPLCNAQRTLTAIVVILGVLLAGIAFLARAYHIGATDPDSPAYQSMISQLVGAVVGRGVFYYITIGSVLAVLALSANTSFADFPRLCRLIAQDDFLPHAFANRGRRLVYSLRHRHSDRFRRHSADRVRRHHGSADSSVCRRRVFGVHAFAGGHGGALEARAAGRTGAIRPCSSTAWARWRRRLRLSS